MKKSTLDKLAHRLARARGGWMLEDAVEVSKMYHWFHYLKHRLNKELPEHALTRELNEIVFVQDGNYLRVSQPLKKLLRPE